MSVYPRFIVFCKQASPVKMSKELSLTYCGATTGAYVDRLRELAVHGLKSKDKETHKEVFLNGTILVVGSKAFKTTDLKDLKKTFLELFHSHLVVCGTSIQIGALLTAYNKAHGVPQGDHWKPLSGDHQAVLFTQLNMEDFRRNLHRFSKDGYHSDVWNRDIKSTISEGKSKLEHSKWASANASAKEFLKKLEVPERNLFIECRLDQSFKKLQHAKDVERREQMGHHLQY